MPPGFFCAPPAAEEPEPQAPAATRPRWWGELLVIVWLAWVYDAITNFAPLRLHAASVRPAPESNDAQAG